MRFAIARLAYPSTAVTSVVSHAASVVRRALGDTVTCQLPARWSVMEEHHPAALFARDAIAAPASILPTPDRIAAPARPVRRGVRVCRAAAESGRMVISGRMDEVCAELERLALCEAASA